MSVIRIDEPDDPRLEDFRSLTDPALRKRYEARRGVFIVESPLAVEALAASVHAPSTRALLVGERRIERMAPTVRTLTDLGVPVYSAPAAVLEATAGFALHRGVVAAVARPDPLAPEDVVTDGGTVLAVEGVNDHENLGGLFRAAAAFGATGVLLDPTGADPWYRRCVRVSMGHVLNVPHARDPRWPDTLVGLARQGWRVLALTPTGDVRLPELVSETLHQRREVDTSSPGLDAGAGAGPSVPAGTVVVVGAEGPGLTDAVLGAVGVTTVRIPMAPGVDSVNVSTAAAIALAHLRSPALP